MRRVEWKAAGFLVLSAAGLGACQILSGLSGYRETASASGATGGGPSSTSGSSTSSGSGVSSTVSSSGASSTGASSSASTGSAGTGGAQGCTGRVVCDILGQVQTLRTNGDAVGWTTTGSLLDGSAVGWASTSKVPTTSQSTVSSSLFDISVLAMDPQNLWLLVDNGTSPSVAYWPIEPDGSTAYSLLSPTAQLLKTIAAGGNYVVWAQQDEATMKWSLAGSHAMATPATLTGIDGQPSLLATDGTYVFWSLGTDVWATPSGSTTSFFSGTLRVVDIVIEPVGHDVYWLMANGTIYQAPEATPSSYTMVYPHTTGGAVRQLATDGTYLYWAEWTDCQSSGAVYQALLSNPTPPAAPFVSASCPWMALDAKNQYLYWSETSPSGNKTSTIGRTSTP